MERSARIVLIGAILIGLSGCSVFMGNGAGQEPGALALSDLPGPARATIQKLIGGGEIRKLEREEEAGAVIYDVEARVDGKEVEYDVRSDGVVLSSEESVAFRSLPPPVRWAARKYFGSGEGLKASKEVEEGKTFYEVEGKKDGVAVELKLTDSGEIIEEERE